MSITRPTFRFAPSPNGRLHLGHAYSALLNASLAEKTQGRFLLRMEDIDITRCTPELAQACLNDLAWLGLRWEEPVRTQSRHWADYTQLRDALIMTGYLYPCFCTRSEVASHSSQRDPDGAPVYPGTCTHLSFEEASARIEGEEPHSWRLHMQSTLARHPGPHSYTRFDPETMHTETVPADPARWGDVILARKDIPTSYHLSVVHDDALQHVTHIVRGKDLEAATDLHTLLQTILRFPHPHYHHHALVKDESHAKLAKSNRSQSLADLRSHGQTPESIRKWLEIA